MSQSEMMFDYLFYRMETTYAPTWTVSGMSYSFQVYVYYVGLNADGYCQRGVRYGETGAVVPKAEGTYEIVGDELHLSWSDGEDERGLLSVDRDELVVAGQAYQAGANKLGRAE